MVCIQALVTLKSERDDLDTGERSTAYHDNTNSVSTWPGSSIGLFPFLSCDGGMMCLNQASESFVFIIEKKKKKKERKFLGPIPHIINLWWSQDATFGISFPNDSQPIKVWKALDQWLWQVLTHSGDGSWEGHRKLPKNLWERICVGTFTKLESWHH